MTTQVQCGTCNTVADAKFVHVFPGTRKFTCSGCRTVHRFGLATSTKVLYGVFLAMFVIGAAMGLVGAGTPTILVFIVSFAFYKDWEARNAVQTARIVGR